MTCRTSILDGLDVNILKARLTAMQQAYLDLSTGAKGENYSYSQGEGSQSVTYTKANIDGLIAAIMTVQSQIDRLSGVRLNRRTPLTPYF